MEIIFIFGLLKLLPEVPFKNKGLNMLLVALIVRLNIGENCLVA